MKHAGRAREKIDTVASYKLRNLGRTMQQIATDNGAKYVVVTQWCDGRRRASADWREQLKDYSARFSKDPIAFKDWDTPLTKAKLKGGRKSGMSAAVAVAVTKAALATTPDQVVDEAGKLIDAVRSLRDEVQKAGTDSEYGPSVSERAKIFSQCATMLDKAARLTGASSDISPAKILRSPSWGKVATKIVAALEPWPDAMRAVAEMLKAEVS